jgi:hypothetical protein
MMNCKEIWVYAASHDHIARSFYMSLDFRILGPARECPW